MSKPIPKEALEALKYMSNNSFAKKAKKQEDTTEVKQAEPEKKAKEEIKKIVKEDVAEEKKETVPSESSEIIEPDKNKQESGRVEKPAATKEAKNKKEQVTFTIPSNLHAEIRKQTKTKLKEANKSQFVEIGAKILLGLNPRTYGEIKYRAYEQDKSIDQIIVEIIEAAVKP